MARLASLALVAACSGGGSAGGHAWPAVPHTTGAIHIDGEWDEPDWPQHALRRQFVGDDGELARPSSDVRLLQDDATVYVGLYAADDDLESATDAFDVVVGGLAMRADVAGRIAPAMPDVHAGIDRDGTLDDPSNFDEEWVLEIAVPRARVFGASATGAVYVVASRCDTPRRSATRCGEWSGFVDFR